jgi:hypothetical protein
MKIKKWNNFNEDLKYVVGNNDTEDHDIDVFSGDPEWSDDVITRSIVDNYIRQIEDATGAKVIRVEGEANDSDSKLYFELDDDNDVYVTYMENNRGGQMVVEVHGNFKGGVAKKSYGDKNKKSDNKYKVEDDVYHMIKDIYIENNLIEPDKIEPSYKIDLPRELFGNEPYFSYHSDERTDQTTVYFESEESAQDWINSLKITKNNNK